MAYGWYSLPTDISDKIIYSAMYRTETFTQKFLREQKHRAEIERIGTKPPRGAGVMFTEAHFLRDVFRRYKGEK